MENSKKKIAICLWGQTRTFRTLDNYYRSHKDFEFDYFVSTWDDFKDKTPFNFFKDKEFIDPKIINFKNNTDKAFYCIHRVNNLKSKYELNNGFVYDYILWTRSEILFESKYLLEYIVSKLNFTKYDDNHKLTEINTLSDIKSEIDRDSEEEVLRLDADYSFLGTSLAFDLYASGWKYYFKSRKCDDFHARSGGHHAHASVIKKFNLEAVKCKIAHKFQFSKLYKREV